MPLIDQLYNAPASISDTFIVGTIIFIVGIIAGIFGYRSRKKL